MEKGFVPNGVVGLNENNNPIIHLGALYLKAVGQHIIDMDPTAKQVYETIKNQLILIHINPEEKENV